MKEAIKRLEKRIADELDDQAWNDLQVLYKYIRELEAVRKINLGDRVKVINVGSASDSTKDLIGTVRAYYYRSEVTNISIF